MEVDPSDVAPDEVYRTLAGVVVPRPIAWVSTLSPDGTENLAPFSFFTIANNDAPPVVMFSPGETDGRKKDTTRNALETGEFVVNAVSPALVRAADATSESIPPGESEFEHAGVEGAPSVRVAPRRVARSPASLECVLHDSVAVGDHTVLMGEVVYLHLAEEILTDGRVDTRKVETVGRLGGPYYTAIDRLDLESDTLMRSLDG